jgi:rfaE bifunctional protein kinase chain/domain
MMDQARLEYLLQKFPAQHVVVVGDFFLDKYLSIDPALSEISLETGLEAYQVVQIRHSPGAAGTVVSNLRALDVQVSVIGVIGQDGAGYDLKQGLQQRGVSTDSLFETPHRFTPTYTKPMLQAAVAGGVERELNRLDVKNRHPLPNELEKAVITQLERLTPLVDGIIVADQVQERNCGVITDMVRLTLARLARRYPAKVFAVDSRVRIGEYEGLLLKPNLPEASAAVNGVDWPQGQSLSPTEELELAHKCGEMLFQKGQKPVFVTLGSQGILVVTQHGADHLPGIRVTGKLDIVGAGDSVMAGLVATLCAGGTATEAAWVGNLAASITIQQIGTTGVASREQLRQAAYEMA